MIKTVWKYKIPIADEFEIEMPAFSKILSFQSQGNDLCLWALVFPELEKIKEKFILRGTGHLIDCDLDLDYIGSVQIKVYETLIFHLFKEKHQKEKHEK